MNVGTYTVIRDDTVKYAFINVNLSNGMKFTPKSNLKNITIEIDQINVLSTKFINKILYHKTRAKLEIYVQYLMQLSDDDGSDEEVGIFLDDIVNYRKIIERDYKDRMDKVYYKLLLGKLDIIEKELKAKKDYYIMIEAKRKRNETTQKYFNNQVYEEVNYQKSK